MGKIFYIMGKSSSGKDTVFKEIKRLLPELKTIILYTTRPIRDGEKNGEEYFFVDRVRREELVKSGKVIELRAYDTVHGVWEYFTVDDGQIQLENHNYLVIGTLESYNQMKEYFGEEALVPLYIEVEDGERLTRALEREKIQKIPKYAELCRRFLADCEDFSEENLIKAGIKKRYQNRSISECAEEIVLCIRRQL